MVLSTIRTKLGQEFYLKVISNYWTGSLYWITVMDCDLLIVPAPKQMCTWVTHFFVASHYICLTTIITAILGNKTWYE